MAASSLTLRSASISSSSTANSSKSANDGIKKKFGCIHPGCGKSFSRSEHLHRHALNHKDGNHTCMRCSAHFRRRDLLDRHMARHKEKDDEAGGEGLGVLATRKRLWRDADGNIVNARRPSYTQDGNKRRMLGGRGSQQQQTRRKGSQSSSSFDDDSERRLSTVSSIEIRSTLISLPSPPNRMSRAGSTHSTIIVDTNRRHGAHTRQGRQAESDSENDAEAEPDLSLDQEDADGDLDCVRPLDQTPSWMLPPSPPYSTSPASYTTLTTSSTATSSTTNSLPQSPSLAAADPEAELETLYEEPSTATSWQPHSSLPHILNNLNTSPNAQMHEYPISPSWNTTPQQSSFQTFMGSVGEYEDLAQAQNLKGSSHDEGIYGMGGGYLGMQSSAVGGLYAWQNPWGGQMMLSRVREEKYEVPQQQQVQSANLFERLGAGVVGYGGLEGGSRRGFLGTC